MAKFKYCLTQYFDWKSQTSKNKKLLDCRDCSQKYKCRKYINRLIEEDARAR